jgi:glutathione-regulated potassium-efflux system ancillary protein KefC/glutathione-regulated potassium-efflux system protein KefB
VVERETFEGGLAIGEKALRALGVAPEEAAKASASFRRHDEDMITALAKVWGDEEKYAVALRESSDRMNQLLAADMEERSTIPEA